MDHSCLCAGILQLLAATCAADPLLSQLLGASANSHPCNSSSSSGCTTDTTSSTTSWSSLPAAVAPAAAAAAAAAAAPAQYSETATSGSFSSISSTEAPMSQSSSISSTQPCSISSRAIRGCDPTAPITKLMAACKEEQWMSTLSPAAAGAVGQIIMRYVKFNQTNSSLSCLYLESYALCHGRRTAQKLCTNISHNPKRTGSGRDSEYGRNSSCFQGFLLK